MAGGRGYSSDGIYFTIKEVAKQVDVVPATIRNWEKAGLIRIRRSPNGYRIFDLHDIEYLKKIKNKSKDENIGINGIKLLFQDEKAADRTELPDIPHMPQGVSKRLLGQKWKEYRLKRGYNLDEVANLVGISPSYLSKIENEQANVSYDILQRLAEFYGENLLFYLEDSAESSPIVKKGTAEAFEIGIEGLKVESLIAQSRHTMAAMLYTIQPGSERGGDSVHNGEEFVYVLAGKVEFILNNTDTYMLSAGDSMCYSSQVPHRWRNGGAREAKLLWIYTPLTKL